jgi:predicted nucleotide-binding protein (sugar kinase/HSP70/actin superfamily)
MASSGKWRCPTDPSMAKWVKKELSKIPDKVLTAASYFAFQDENVLLKDAVSHYQAEITDLEEKLQRSFSFRSMIAAW